MKGGVFLSGYFKRAFAVAFSVIVLFIVLVFAFELINRRTEKSGFSSGEFLLLDYKEPYFFGEVFGREFYFDLSLPLKILSAARDFLFVFPPFIRFFFLAVLRG